jgi:DNA-binding MarR family transcriptional regulator
VAGTPPQPSPAVAAGTSSEDVLAVIESTMTRVARRSNLPRSHQRLIQRARVDIDRASYAVLATIAEQAPVRLTELASAMGVDVSTASRQVATLESRGWVSRVEDPIDGRSSLLALTASGAKLLARLRKARCDAWSELLSRWPDDDLAQLARLLGRLATDLQIRPEPGR